MSTPTESHQRNYRADIEGLRAVAILLVVLYHAGVPGLPGGFVGVDIFFVLSGYLITGLLCREIERSGRVQFAAFYARRARRLLPAAAVVVIVTLIAARYVYSPQEMIALAKDALTTSLYASNLWFAHISTDYLAADAAKSPLLHTWSLAVEEQFYLLWPALIVVAYRGINSRPASRKRLLITMLILALASLALSQWLISIAQPWAFFASPSRAWEFAAGGVAGLVASPWMACHHHLRNLCFWGGLIMIALATTTFSHDTVFPGMAALLPVSGAVLVLVSHVPDTTGVNTRLLDNRLMQWLGSRSYSWYLWHWPVLVLLRNLDPGQGLPLAFAGLGLSLAMAEMSYRWVENPVRFNHRLIHSPAYSLALAMMLTLFTAGSSQWWRHAEGVKSRSPSQIRFTLAMRDVPQKIYDSNCHLSLLAVKADACVFGDPTATTTVVLFGDSHAAQWFPALETLARQQHWRLVSLTKSACPIAWLDTRNRQLGRTYDECSRWRRITVNRIIKLQPDIVVMGYYRYVSIPDDAGGAPISRAAWQTGVHHTLALFSRAGIAVAVMRDSPRPGFNVPTCLARKTENHWRGLNCDFPRQPALDSVEYDLIRRAAADLPQVSFIDLSTSICADAECNPVDQATGTVLYRDSHHLTTAFVRQIAPSLNAQLEALLGSGQHEPGIGLLEQQPGGTPNAHSKIDWLPSTLYGGNWLFGVSQNQTYP